MTAAESGTGDRKHPAGGALGAATAGAGASLLAGVAGACCVGPTIAPLIVGALGAGGAAWAAGLEPYSPYLLAGSGLLLAYAFTALYRTPPAECDPADRAVGKHPEAAPDRRGATEWSRGLAKVVAWFAAVLWMLALGANLAAL